MKQWQWQVIGYYGPEGRASTPRNPNKGRLGELAGDMAITTVHTSESSADTEVSVLKSRSDIGHIVKKRLHR